MQSVSVICINWEMSLARFVTDKSFLTCGNYYNLFFFLCLHSLHFLISRKIFQAIVSWDFLDLCYVPFWIYGYVCLCSVICTSANLSKIYQRWYISKTALGLGWKRQKIRRRIIMEAYLFCMCVNITQERIWIMLHLPSCPFGSPLVVAHVHKGLIDTSSGLLP